MKESIAEGITLFSTLGVLEPPLAQAAQLALKATESGQKILVCGNGGSACEEQHLAGELLGRYEQDRRALAAIALNADGAMSCIANDYRFEDVFSRQIEAFARPGDVLVVFATSGQSPNVLAALTTARRFRVASVAFLGRDGGAALRLADVALVVPHPQTNRVQEAHQLLLHCLMDRIEQGIA